MGKDQPSATRVGPAAREAIFAQLADAGRAEQVARRLTDAIILGVLEDGERLPSETELARRFGVAVITVREGLGMLRESQLVETRRGRDGGSFVTSGTGHEGALEARLRTVSRVELADMAVYFATILGGCAERAAARSTDEEGDRLATWLSGASFDSPAAARANTGGFYLEVAVLSQSPRLVREQIRVQAEYGPLLLLALDDGAERESTARVNALIADAIRAHDGDRARELVLGQLDAHSRGLLRAKDAMDREAVSRGRTRTHA
ncbi:FadR/GntR family transcriptional regulator [Humibacter sp. RRB41]|uniref:FadR/GntR family transcriptional regulator n=1 Tax=Humibacter sp. RRB41 TaxID=2919946 RepID=UPI001FAAB375|nr:GntR family transcriptional regulator [Humibacter sp. RRB41]